MLVTHAEVHDLSGYSSRVEGIGVEKPYYSPYIAKKQEGDAQASQLRWYGYGSAISLVALVPYVFTAILNMSYMPQANVLARAWGAAVAAAIPISAIPATKQWPWGDVRMKRLMRAAVIAHYLHVADNLSVCARLTLRRGLSLVRQELAELMLDSAGD